MEEGIEWTEKLSFIPPFAHASLKEHLITGDSSKLGKPPNAHKHKKYGYQLFKDKMVTQVVVKADVLKGREKFFLVKNVVHASMKKAHFAKHVNVEGLKKLQDGLETVGTCDYLQGLLVADNCEPFQHQELVEEMPSKKAFNEANYLQIKCTIMRFENLYLNKLLFLTLPKCANIYHLQNMQHTLKTLFLQ